MTTRHAHTRALAAAYQRARENERIAYHALMGALSENQRKVYAQMQVYGRDVSSEGLAKSNAWSIQYASSVLKELADFGLLEREAVLTDSGREFRYRLAK